MAKGKITKSAVDDLSPASRPVFLWDTEKPGFGIKVTPAGKKVYVLQYRMGGRGSPTRRYTIGQHGVAWTADSAKKEASRLLLMVDQGIDPIASRQKVERDSLELSFNAVADSFLELEVKPNWRKSYNFAESALRLHVRPHLKDTPLPSLTTSDLVRVFDKMPVGQPSIRRNTHAVLSRMLRWAVARDYISSNPLATMEKPRAVASRDRVLTDDEVKLIWRGSASLPAPYGGWVRLLLLTGQRRNEVAAADWRELARAKGQWMIDGERTKNGATHILPLSSLAVAELDALAGGDEWPASGLLFPSSKGTPISGFSKIKRLLDKAMAANADGIEAGDWRFHDARRTMATVMQRLRISGDVIEACENRLAGNSKAGSAKVYQRHQYLEEKTEAMQAWGSFIERIVDGQTNVVPLAARQA